MKITVKIGLLFAAIWIAIKMILFLTVTGEARFNVTPAIMLNILCLLLAITVGLYLHKRRQTEYTNALGDIKSAMSSAMIYAAIVAGFIYLYYNNIDPEFNRHQISEAEVQIDKVLNDPEQLKQLKASNEDFEVKTVPELRKMLMDNQKAIFSPGSTMTISLLAMLVLGTLNSIFVTVIMRRVVFRQPRSNSSPRAS